MRRIEQNLLSIHFKLVITAHLDTINQVENSEQAHKQVKHDIKIFVIPVIFSINSELSALFTLDLIPVTFIVQDITQSPNDRILQLFPASAFNSSSVISIPLITTQLLNDKIFMHFISPPLNSNLAVNISSIMI